MQYDILFKANVRNGTIYSKRNGKINFFVVQKRDSTHIVRARAYPIQNDNNYTVVIVRTVSPGFMESLR